MYMGIVRLPSMTDHWENGVVLRPTAVSQIMPRDRFYVLFQFLHLNEDKYDFKTDKIYKIRRLILTLLPNFKKYYQIDEHISIDEKMIKFTGRSCMKQYIKQKASKWGFKAFILAEARSGYVYDWILYEGKQGPTPKKNLAANIVTQLVRGLENKGHRLYTDNYYTSVDLALSLMDKQIGLTGTIRSNRKKLPKEVLKKKDVERGQILTARSGNILFMRWKDKRDIFMISTVTDASRVRMTEKPNMIKDYVQNMRGVDRGDQMSSYYNFDHRSVKWWKRILFSLMETSILNSFILYKNVTKMNTSFLSYREYIIYELWNDHKKKLVQLTQSPLVEARLNQSHEISKRERRNCFVCSTTEERKTTSFYCVQCKKNVHPEKCFKILHEKIDLKCRKKLRNTL